MTKTYVAIDLKSFYASVECVERHLDPLTTNLVVADSSRTEKTICLAVSPSLKAYGISGRARLFEVVQRVKEINNTRRWHAPNKTFEKMCCDDKQLQQHPECGVDYIVAPPRMAFYIDYSTKIYQIYLKYVSPDDVHVYSIDEVFIDATQYLKLYNMTAHQFAMTLIGDILKSTGITATAGIGTNLYLCKIAMDIVAKHAPADKDGVRIAFLDEQTYREKLWDHRPLTDFWRVGTGYKNKLESYGMFTMGDVARCSVTNEQLLYDLFGINAELLIDHAWGWEPCTIADVKGYKPQSHSLSSGQVLQEPYNFSKARLVLGEMAEELSLDLVSKQLVTDQIVVTIGYDVANTHFKGEFSIDRYGRKIPKHSHGTENLDRQTASTKIIVAAAHKLFDKIADKNLLVRRLNITANNVVAERQAKKQVFKQMDLFELDSPDPQQEKEQLEKEKRRQKTVIQIKEKFGKNAILKGADLQEGATAKSRNGQIGGHKA